MIFDIHCLIKLTFYTNFIDVWAKAVQNRISKNGRREIREYGEPGMGSPLYSNFIYLNDK